jgi:hypothetical protein
MAAKPAQTIDAWTSSEVPCESIVLSRDYLRQKRGGDGGIAWGDDVYADTAAIDLIRYDPQRIRPIARRRLAAVGRLLLEGDHANALIVGPDRFDDLLVAASVVGTHEQNYPKLAAKVHRRAYSQATQVVGVADDENFVST